ncbi:TPA: hypothetical protein QDB05_000222 [Burkholderia vietnamiensis]|nr:hypothetical protein [Burkholderia vietnamiensis]
MSALIFDNTSWRRSAGIALAMARISSMSSHLGDKAVGVRTAESASQDTAVRSEVPSISCPQGFAFCYERAAFSFRWHYF